MFVITFLRELMVNNEKLCLFLPSPKGRLWKDLHSYLVSFMKTWRPSAQWSASCTTTSVPPPTPGTMLVTIFPHIGMMWPGRISEIVLLAGSGNDLGGSTHPMKNMISLCYISHGPLEKLYILELEELGSSPGSAPYKWRDLAQVT